MKVCPLFLVGNDREAIKYETEKYRCIEYDCAFYQGECVFVNLATLSTLLDNLEKLLKILYLKM